MPVGNALDKHDEFRLVLGNYYKVERERAERCIADIVNIFGNADEEPKQVEDVLARLTAHYSRQA